MGHVHELRKKKSKWPKNLGLNIGCCFSEYSYLPQSMGEGVWILMLGSLWRKLEPIFDH